MGASGYFGNVFVVLRFKNELQAASPTFIIHSSLGITENREIWETAASCKKNDGYERFEQCIVDWIFDSPRNLKFLLGSCNVMFQSFLNSALFIFVDLVSKILSMQTCTHKQQKIVWRGCLVTKNKKSWTIKWSSWSKFSEWIRCSTYASLQCCLLFKEDFFCLDKMRVCSIKTNTHSLHAGDISVNTKAVRAKFWESSKGEMFSLQEKSVLPSAYMTEPLEDSAFL